MIRIALPYHLRTLARIEGDIALDVPPPVTFAAVLDALESRFPTLRGTIRDPHTGQRRPFIRFFAHKEDLSHEPLSTHVPPDVASGQEPLLIIGAMAGG